ncbi:transcriptional regulator [Micropruina sonneratiae]|uniref:transcriptional regulator n=1 Tax=Micropruina sonneratiae TaxID=2986940 RepID=UPI002227663E|nr:transcriptional regulator [Micropruina sp. KQZ13P-5]MCW3158380.1 transcriptional regulator [Micropruina sp. KQZ13P-5]
MTRPSPPPLLVLHAVRLLGLADSAAIAERAGVGHDHTVEVLHDAEQHGWVQYNSFAGLEGWSLTEEGRTENERQLADERASADPDDVIAAVHRNFLPLNARLVRACTDWQVKPTSEDKLAPNDHTDPAWDAPILDELAALSAALAPLIERLAGVLIRFAGCDTRFDAALHRARAGENEWVDRTDIDSCHRVWFQLHEDLVATLGIDRRTEY